MCKYIIRSVGSTLLGKKEKVNMKISFRLIAITSYHFPGF